MLGATSAASCKLSPAVFVARVDADDSGALLSGTTVSLLSGTVVELLSGNTEA